MKSTAAFSILVIVVVIGSIKCNKTELVIASLTSSWTEPAIKGIRLAIDTAKNSPQFKSFLEKYEINLVSFATHGDPSNAIYASSFYVGSKPNGSKPDGYALLVLGPQTPLEAVLVLQTIRFYRKLMVTYLTTSSDVKELTDPYGFTFAPSAFAFNKASIRMMEFFNWKRAAGLYDFLETGGLYVKVVDNLIKNADFEIIDFEAINTKSIVKSVHDYIQEKLNKLRDLDTKIFFGEFNKRGASLVFCELYKMKMFGPEFGWILHADAGTIEEWHQLDLEEMQKPDYNNATKPCTKEEFRQAVEGAFIFDKYIAYRTDEDTPTDSGLSLRQVFSHPAVQRYTDIKKTERATAFDTMWAVMLALKNASLELPLEHNVKEIQGNKTITETITKMLKNLKFEGLTGPISFTDNEEREGIIAVRQFRNGTLVRIGTHFTKDDKFVLCCNFTTESLFKDGRIPFDRSQIEPKPRIVAPELFIIFSTASSIGIVLGIMFLVFNRYYRKYKFIRLSAPLFNDVMVVGCIMCLSTVFLFGLRDFKAPEITFPPICKARAWILNIGFSLAFGAMFMKTWRIYKICTNKRLKVRLGPLSDWTMLAMVGGIVLIDVALLIAWEVEDPLKWTQHNFTTETNPDKPFVIITPTLNTCTAKYLNVWLALIYVYKGIMLLYGLFLAYETRNVVYAHLNDSRVIGICVYNTVVLSTIGAFLALILNNEQYEQLYAALSVCIIFPATATISLIFIPKLIHRVKMNSLDDETGETTIHNTFTRPSIDMTSTVNDTDKGRERFVDATSTNTLCVYQNGEAGLSPTPSPSPPTTFQQLSPHTLED